MCSASRCRMLLFCDVQSNMWRRYSKVKIAKGLLCCFILPAVVRLAQHTRCCGKQHTTKCNRKEVFLPAACWSRETKVEIHFCVGQLSPEQFSCCRNSNVKMPEAPLLLFPWFQLIWWLSGLLDFFLWSSEDVELALLDVEGLDCPLLVWVAVRAVAVGGEFDGGEDAHHFRISYSRRVQHAW